MTGTRNDIAGSPTDSSQVPCLSAQAERFRRLSQRPRRLCLADADANADAVGCALLYPYIGCSFLTGSGWNLTANPAWP